MPVIKSAIKKLRRDKKREKLNDEFRKSLDKSIKDARKKKSQSAVVVAVSMVDRAVKNDVIHKNRAARIKSSLSKLSKPSGKTAKPAAAPKKAAKTVKKAPSAKKSSKKS